MRCRMRGHVDALARDLLTLEEDAPGLDRLEQVDAAEKRALAAPARPDDDEHLAGFDAQVDAVEDDVVAEALADVLRCGPWRPIRACPSTAVAATLTAQRRSKEIAFVASQAVDVPVQRRTLSAVHVVERKGMTMKVAYLISVRLGAASI